jgi:hypothetical protein
VVKHMGCLSEVCGSIPDKLIMFFFISHLGAALELSLLIKTKLLLCCGHFKRLLVGSSILSIIVLNFCITSHNEFL